MTFTFIQQLSEFNLELEAHLKGPPNRGGLCYTICFKLYNMHLFYLFIYLFTVCLLRLSVAPIM